MAAKRELNEILDEANSLHEAGYAIMTLLTGTTLGYIELKHPSEDGWGQGRTARAVPDGPEREVLIKIAGVGVELIHCGLLAWSWSSTDSGKRDREAAQPYINAIGGNRRSVIRELKVKVIQMLNENWESVLVVSRMLREKRYLGGEEVAALRDVVEVGVHLQDLNIKCTESTSHVPPSPPIA